MGGILPGARVPATLSARVAYLDGAPAPVYPLTEGLNQTTVRKAVKQALALCESHTEALKDWLPEAALKEKGLIRFEGRDYIMKANDIVEFL